MLRYRVKGVTPLPACSCRLFARTLDISAVSNVVSRGVFKTWLAQRLTSAVLQSNASYSVKHTVAESPIIIATVQQVILRHVLLQALMCLVCWAVKHYLSCNTSQHSWHVIAINCVCMITIINLFSTNALICFAWRFVVHLFNCFTYHHA